MMPNALKACSIEIKFKCHQTFIAILAGVPSVARVNKVDFLGVF